jgi:hypothetical protein
MPQAFLRTAGRGTVFLDDLASELQVTHLSGFRPMLREAVQFPLDRVLDMRAVQLPKQE